MDSRGSSRIYSQKLTLTVAYDKVNTIQYFLGQKGINISDSRYAADVQFDICVRESDLQKVKDELVSKCEGQIDIAEGDKDFFLL